MRRIILALALLVATRSNAADEAPIPKEGTIASTTAGSGTLKVLPLGKERAQLTWEWFGVQQSDDGKGILHNASVRCVGGLHAFGGEYQTYSNACVFTRPDGDQVFTIETATGKVGGTAKGTVQFLGGTGKMAGITGSAEFTRWGVRPAAEGTFQTVTRATTTYRLP